MVLDLVLLVSKTFMVVTSGTQRCMALSDVLSPPRPDNLVLFAPSMVYTVGKMQWANAQHTHECSTSEDSRTKVQCKIKIHPTQCLIIQDNSPASLLSLNALQPRSRNPCTILDEILATPTRTVQTRTTKHTILWYFAVQVT